MIAPWASPTRTLAAAVGAREQDDEEEDEEFPLPPQSALGSGVASVAAVQAANDAESTAEGPKRAAAHPPGICEAA